MGTGLKTSQTSAARGARHLYMRQIASELDPLALDEFAHHAAEPLGRKTLRVRTTILWPDRAVLALKPLYYRHDCFEHLLAEKQAGRRLGAQRLYRLGGATLAKCNHGRATSRCLNRGDAKVFLCGMTQPSKTRSCAHTA